MSFASRQLARRRPQVHVMVDTETLGLKPNAAIVELAAVYVDDHGTKQYFNYAVPPEEYDKLTHIFSVEEVSIAFHISENSDNWRSWKYSTGTVHNMVQSFMGWLAMATLHGKKELVLWCEGIDFDIPKLSHLMRMFIGDKPLPWKYYNVRDLRTLQAVFYKEIVAAEFRNDNVHSALGDAVYQYDILEFIFELLEQGGMA